MQKHNQAFIGTWELVSWVMHNKEGQKYFPYGEDAKGFLIYTDSGLMSVHIMKYQRPLFQSQSLFDVTPEEALQSYSSYISYCGRFEILPDRVVHYIQMHTSPNWIGATVERHYNLDDDLLYLSHTLDGQLSQLVWKKIR